MVLAGDTTLEHEVACIDLTPLDEGDNTTRTSVASLGFWTDESKFALAYECSQPLEKLTKKSIFNIEHLLF